MVWTTAVINGDMNFADTLYWLQIATTTASNHSSNNSLVPALPNSFFLNTHISVIQYWSPKSQTFNVSLIISALQKMILRLQKWGQLHRHSTSWKKPLWVWECCFDEWSNLLIWNSCTMVSQITGKQIVQLSLIVQEVQYFMVFDLALL